ncbi:hypothetical protein DPMN_109371 [Dreissena polymorpha]|uniref:Uncharacterized protein n=1 Tax=Dreissena polymorpha TaxID=45954 RepID=A0A9D4KA57_DREPO|nr:hypothetical protein DPMN_109371 [Dreissena polymorpha]
MLCPVTGHAMTGVVTGHAMTSPVTGQPVTGHAMTGLVTGHEMTDPVTGYRSVPQTVPVTVDVDTTLSVLHKGRRSLVSTVSHRRKRVVSDVSGYSSTSGSSSYDSSSQHTLQPFIQPLSIIYIQTLVCKHIRLKVQGLI